MLALIDQDLVCYRCSASAENEPIEIAYERIDTLMDRLILETSASEYRAFLTGKDNFRKQIYPEYKANRTQPKPVHLQECREYAISKWNAEVVDGMEADDALAINQTEDSCIVSLDKDLLQCPGLHYSWEISGISHGKEWKREARFTTISEIEGLRNFYTQVLMGDKSDNIRGLEGIGEKKAQQALAGCTSEKTMFTTVRGMYDSDEHLLMTGRVLWIKRTLDDDWGNHFDRLDSITS